MGKSVFSRFVPYCLALLCSAGTLAAAPRAEFSAPLDATGPVGVPGNVLPAGTYTIQVASHLAKRYIMHVVDANGAVRAVFLGMPDLDVPTGTTGKAMWAHDVKGVTYVKGWAFQAGPRLEFVYPKLEAVAIAQANQTRVAAVDPASDGLLPQLKDLPAKDFELLTLWLLTPTRVGGAPGIDAKKYDQVASVHKPVVAKLPHTASELGWFYVAGVLSLAGALGMRRFAGLQGE